MSNVAHDIVAKLRNLCNVLKDEVQTKGSIDGLILNLLKSLNNPAVQGLVAVSDAGRIATIKKHAAGDPGLGDKLKCWDYQQVLQVHESLDKQIRDSIEDKAHPMAALAVFPPVIAALEWWRWYRDLPPKPVLATILAVIGWAWFLVWLPIHRRRLRAMRQGLEGERAVAEYLDREDEKLSSEDVKTLAWQVKQYFGLRG